MKGVFLYTVSFIKNIVISLHWVKLHLDQVKYLLGSLYDMIMTL